MINIYKSGKYDITLEFDNFGLYNILNAFEIPRLYINGNYNMLQFILKIKKGKIR